MATGPYPGTFRESGGYSYSSVAGKQPYYLHFSASFTITSGGATITGSLVFRYPGAWVVVGCPGAMFSNLPVNYTTVVGGQTYQGTAKVGVSAKAEAAVSQSFTG
jgi:hypothetical protein